MEPLGIDIETFSAVDIKEYGADAYARHPSTGVWCVAYGFTPDNVDIWIPGEPMPRAVTDHALAGGPFLAHNAAFERAILSHILYRNGWPIPVLHRWRDTQTLAAAANLPLNLEALADALAATPKDTDGAKLMRRAARAHPLTWAPPVLTDEERERLHEYCRQDVRSMLECYARLPKLSLTETVLAHLDARINTRGVYLDQEFAAALLRLVRERKEQLADEAFESSSGELSNAVGAPSLRDWLIERGFALPMVKGKPSIHRKFVTDALDGDIDDERVREVLENRIEASKITSLGKLKRVSVMVDPQGRLRNGFRYSLAHTGRWAGSGIQLHNLPRSKFRPGDLDRFRALVQKRDLVGIGLLERPLEVFSQLLRGVVSASPGHELIGGDFSAIEARVLAWLAGQEDVLDVFRAQDAGTGPDIYVVDAANIGSDDRQLGKTCRLGLGYGMGAVKFAVTGANAPKPILLPLKEWRRIQLTWRENNPAIVAFWYALEEAFRNAMANPGEVFRAGLIEMFARDSYVGMRLPSGRVIRYWRPHTKRVEKTIKTVDDDGELIERKFTVDELRFYTPGGTGMKIESTYSGKLAENATQAVARDLLGVALMRIDPVYPIVVHVHDSIASEVPCGTGDEREFAALMAQTPVWADGLPVAVEPYRSPYFKG